MKKSILSLIALFGVAAVSAQSYPKQPDPTIYEVVKPEKPAVVKEQPANVENAESKADAVQEQPNKDRKAESATADVKATATGVAVNEKKAPAKREK